jgi:hypothetical protein
MGIRLISSKKNRPVGIGTFELMRSDCLSTRHVSVIQSGNVPCPTPKLGVRKSGYPGLSRMIQIFTFSGQSGRGQSSNPTDHPMIEQASKGQSAFTRRISPGWWRGFFID